MVVIIILGGFFFWYNKRFSGLQNLSEGSKDSGGLLANLIGQQPDVTMAVITDDDYDGLSNDEEATAETNANQADSDNDGLNDREEVKVYGTDPKQADSDNDGKSDGDEIQNRSNPKDPSPLAVWPPKPATLQSNN